MEIYEQLILSLRQVNRAVDLHSKQLNKKFGLTGPQLLVIKKIVELKGPMAKMVAEAVNLSPATVTTIIDRLEVNKLVQRKRSDYDKRRVELFVTDKGTSLLLQMPQLLPTTFITQFQGLGSWEQNQLLSSVQRIVDMMESESDAIPSALML
ncbi:winged helix-turn-helix transcriptional regulator [Colwellia demingiae]|uniref:Winged helix-turn-helix transcriptional regulator n=1 Tax=Colwellia demingiae TaxID=89401 RepID=A0A5C6Q4C4_9GAMM|nr:MarR family winged helix-turn-helix transcriptional regulator [Colwellia demingiae]TWX63639.1 winged helix-turn-helix transcriptional regulator [Colwellia demingiae]